MRLSLRSGLVAGVLLATAGTTWADQSLDDLRQAVQQLQQQVNQMSSSMGKSSGDTGLPLHGFIDVGASSDSNGDNKGFNIGKLDFYLTPKLSDHVRALAELNFETSEDGTIGTDLERLQLGYVFNNNVTGWAGRFHTPYGYWNTAFHHGAQIQTSIMRPRFLDFEDGGGILPAHTVGLWLNGNAKASGGKLYYDLYGGNGSKILDGTLDPNLAGDSNHSGIVGASAGYGFNSGALSGLRIGLHGFREDVDSNAYVDPTGATLAANTTTVNMLGGYVVYENDDWQVMGEYYHFHDENLTGSGGTYSSWAGYAQVSRSVGDWTPFVRTEKADLNQHDYYFMDQLNGQSYQRNAAGVAYALDPKSVVKLELDHTAYTDRMRSSDNAIRVQYAIRF